MIPYCLLACCFVPWEHIHLTVSGVDRGRESYTAYNVNRLIFAASFPLLIGAAWLTGILQLAAQNLLLTFCLIFVLSRIIGLIPTLRGLSFTEWIGGPGESAGLPRDGNSKDDQPSAKELLRDGGPYALSMFASELFERLDLLLISCIGNGRRIGLLFRCCSGGGIVDDCTELTCRIHI